MIRDYLALLLRLPGDRLRLGLLLGGLTVTAVFETIGIALVLPFVALLQREDTAPVPERLRPLVELFGAPTRDTLVYLCGATLIAVFLLKTLFVITVYRLQMRFVLRRMALAMRALLASYMARPYTFHLQNNSAVLVRNVMNDTGTVFFQAIPGLFMVAVEALTCLVTAALLIALEPVAVPIAGLGTLLAGFALYRFFRTRLAVIGERLRSDQGTMIRQANQALGGVKEALVLQREDYFVREFSQSGDRVIGKLLTQRTIVMLPRLTLEALGVIGLVLLTLVMLARDASAARVVPMLGVLAIAVVRLIPSATRMLSALADARSSSRTATSLRQDLAQHPVDALAPKRIAAPLPFRREIRIEGVEYTYPEAAGPSLAEVTLTIRKGEALAIVGGSGAGKTTLVDLLIGLLAPARGHIEVDGRRLSTAEDWSAWRRLVGYIPQQVYLCDDTIRRNIAFGLRDDEIDQGALARAVSAARLDEMIRALPAGLETVLGERGVRLSGGQRQRIGIARALYVDPQVLVLDEATSALDGVTEAEVVEAIESAREQRTLLVIAHRLSTVRNCDRIAFMSGGRVQHVGPWEAVRAQSPEFRRMAELAGHS
jgi:ABC-type multidrug transport system fused ATPase/permease subunit